jgi:hypothetical protein
MGETTNERRQNANKHHGSSSWSLGLDLLLIVPEYLLQKDDVKSSSFRRLVWLSSIPAQIVDHGNNADRRQTKK